MILDTSAIVAVLLKEPGSDAMIEKMLGATITGVGAPTLAETAIVLSARLGLDARALLSRFLLESSTLAVPFAEIHFSTAVEAWLRFGKGRHPAALNFGDCLAYATAKLAGEPLLCSGDGFARTDLDLA